MIPPEFVTSQGGVRFASPAYAAVELAGEDDGRALCEALRQGLADQSGIESAAACLAHTRGQVRRSVVVAQATGNPWSYAELRLQRILSEAGIRDWVANRPIRLAGHILRPDIRFRSRRLIVEFDGRATHDNSAQFLADRERINLLESGGYHVLRFGWEHLDQPEYVVKLVRACHLWASPQ
jgi:very-short-patch-repair endonuclease